MTTNYLLAKGPVNPDLCDYILRLDPPFTLMAVTDIDEHGLVSAEGKACKMYSIEGKTFQLTAMHVNDGLSEFYLDTWKR